MDLTYLPLKLLAIGGQHIHSNNTFISMILQGLSIGTLAVLGVAQPIIYKGVENWAKSFETFVPFYQWAIKMLTYSLFRKSFQRLVNDVDKFWPLDLLGKDLEEKIKRYYKFVLIFYKMFLWSAVITVSLMDVKAIITYRTTRLLPSSIYYVVDFSKSPYYEIAFSLFLGQSFCVVFFIVAIDGLFLVLIAGAGCQLIMLQVAFCNIKIDHGQDIDMDLIKKYVDHHNFILEYIKDIKNILSLYLVNQFMASTLSMCIPIYLFSTGSTDIVFLIRCAMYGVASAVQIFIYCISGSQIKAEMEYVANAMYESDWWKSGIPLLRHATLMVMRRSQNANTLKAGGMVELDLQSFVAVLRMSFSFFTLMQSRAAVKPEN